MQNTMLENSTFSNNFWIMCEHFKWELEKRDLWKYSKLDWKFFIKIYFTNFHQNLYILYSIATIGLSFKRMNQKLVHNGMKRENFLSKTVMKSPLLPIIYDLSNSKKNIWGNN